MKKEYWIIEEESIGDFENKKKKIYQCEGPFPSFKEAEKKLREYCSEMFKLGEHENLEKETYKDFCSKFKIAQTLETVHPIPVVNIKTKLKKIKQ
jgi:hypothetical protein